MKRLSTALTAALAFAAITALDAQAQGADVPGVTDTEIKVGSFGPLTGPVYIYGKLTMNGVEVYFNKLNEAGGVHGRKLVLVREDDLCKPEGAIAAVKKLVHDHKVFAIIGGGCSNPTLAARPDIEKERVPFHVFAAVADGIVDPPAPNIYTTQITASIESKAQIQWAIDKGAKKLAIVAQHDAWGRARYEPMIQDFKRRGLQVVADEEVTVDQNDGTAQALKLKASGADAVMLLGYPKAAAVVIRDSIKIGYKPLWVGQTAIQDLPALQGLIGINGALVRLRKYHDGPRPSRQPAVCRVAQAAQGHVPQRRPLGVQSHGDRRGGSVRKGSRSSGQGPHAREVPRGLQHHRQLQELPSTRGRSPARARTSATKARPS